ncbi:ATP-dependent DNA ligase [Nucisporomicrobium flavum]|uniref:ATP-dependent DNA ligase n=1 Tax=Nucisporomicrobium flavum TaxID=2785915 RepID=UPI0018F2E5E1|nr:ATP-dependent DNA ligase [Nucisporomicrobium flavum]
MRAAAVPAPPEPPYPERTVLEPKWDGWRAIAWVQRDRVRLQSRHGIDLSAYFPDVCAALGEHLPPGVVADGELICWDAARGRTSFTDLRRRVSAGRNLQREIARRPVHLVLFDLLQDARGRELLDQPLAARRRRLQKLLVGAPPLLPLCPQTTDPKLAQAWFGEYAVAGIEGLVVKSTDRPYRPATVGWRKVRRRSTTELIIGGVTGMPANPGSLLLGRLDSRGRLHFLAQTHPIKAAQRAELAEHLRPMVFQGDGAGHPWPRPLPAAWSIELTDRRPVPYVQVEPLLVAEVEVDTAVDGPVGRHRHRVRHLRLRPDLAPHNVPSLGARL